MMMITGRSANEAKEGENKGIANEKNKTEHSNRAKTAQAKLSTVTKDTPVFFNWA